MADIVKTLVLLVVIAAVKVRVPTVGLRKLDVGIAPAQKVPQ